MTEWLVSQSGRLYPNGREPSEAGRTSDPLDVHLKTQILRDRSNTQNINIHFKLLRYYTLCSAVIRLNFKLLRCYALCSAVIRLNFKLLRCYALCSAVIRLNLQTLMNFSQSSQAKYLDNFLK
jgi:hypothetical protein